MNHTERQFTPSASQTVGPFFHIGLTFDTNLGKMAGARAQGERIRLKIRVLDSEGLGIPDSMIELWQADAHGTYNHPDDPRAEQFDPAFSGFGRLETDAHGEMIFETVRPGPVPGADGKLQASHINIHVFSRGILLHSSTRIYFAGDPAIEQDAVMQMVPPARRKTLIAQPDPTLPQTWAIDLRLCGKDETVFFDAERT